MNESLCTLLLTTMIRKQDEYIKLFFYSINYIEFFIANYIDH